MYIVSDIKYFMEKFFKINECKLQNQHGNEYHTEIIGKVLYAFMRHISTIFALLLLVLIILVFVLYKDHNIVKSWLWVSDFFIFIHAYLLTKSQWFLFLRLQIKKCVSINHIRSKIRKILNRITNAKAGGISWKNSLSKHRECLITTVDRNNKVVHVGYSDCCKVSKPENVLTINKVKELLTTPVHGIKIIYSRSSTPADRMRAQSLVTGMVCASCQLKSNKTIWANRKQKAAA